MGNVTSSLGQLAQLYEERGMYNEKEQIEQSLKQYDHARTVIIENSLDFRSNL